jgi:hypothetical protein
MSALQYGPDLRARPTSAHWQSRRVSARRRRPNRLRASAFHVSLFPEARAFLDSPITATRKVETRNAVSRLFFYDFFLQATSATLSSCGRLPSVRNPLDARPRLRDQHSRGQWRVTCVGYPRPSLRLRCEGYTRASSEAYRVRPAGLLACLGVGSSRSAAIRPSLLVSTMRADQQQQFESCRPSAVGRHAAPSMRLHEHNALTVLFPKLVPLKSVA